jgi:hypothetical protein
MPSEPSYGEQFPVVINARLFLGVPQCRGHLGVGVGFASHIKETKGSPALVGASKTWPPASSAAAWMSFLIRSGNPQSEHSESALPRKRTFLRDYEYTP